MRKTLGRLMLAAEHCPLLILIIWLHITPVHRSFAQDEFDGNYSTPRDYSVAVILAKLFVYVHSAGMRLLHPAHIMDADNMNITTSI